MTILHIDAEWGAGMVKSEEPHISWHVNEVDLNKRGPLTKGDPYLPVNITCIS